jgi:integrase
MTEKRTDRTRHEPGEIWIHEFEPGGTKYATWYDKEAGQTRHRSLGTSDTAVAQIELAKFIIQRHAPETPPEDPTLAFVLAFYYENHASTLPSWRPAQDAITLWLDFFGGARVSALTPKKLDEFEKRLAKLGYAKSTQNRILAVGRAACYFTQKKGWLASVPRVPYAEGPRAVFNKTPKGRPLSLEEEAALFEAASSDRMFRFLMLLSTTLSRPGALLELTDAQIDHEHRLVDLNPPGREQTSKHRPVLKMPYALATMLDPEEKGPLLLTYLGRPIRHISDGFRQLRLKAGFFMRDADGNVIEERDLNTGRWVPSPDLAVTPYSFRHTMARALRAAGVPLEQIDLYLGHRPPKVNRLSFIYAPYAPEYCAEAVRAIDWHMYEVQQRCKRQIITPDLLSHYVRDEAAAVNWQLERLVKTLHAAGRPVDPTITRLFAILRKLSA